MLFRGYRGNTNSSESPRAGTRVREGIVPILAQDDGSALLEFAISGLLLFTIVFGVIECSRALYIDHFVANAAREATRYASVRGASSSTACSSTVVYSCAASSSDVTSFVQSIATAGVRTANLTVGTTWPGTDATGAACPATGPANSPGCLVMVTVAYTFTYNLPFLSSKAIQLSNSSKVTIVQ